MIRRPPRSTRTDTLLPDAPLCRSRVPPNVGEGLRTLLDGARQGRRFATLGLGRQRDVLDLFTKSARTMLDGWFESEAVKAAFGFDAVVGNYASPDTPGSAYVLLRSEEHTSELQSLMRISYAVFCLKKKKKNITQ